MKQKSAAPKLVPLAPTHYQEKRAAPREDIEHLQASNICSLQNLALIAHYGEIIEASKTGFCLLIERKNLLPSVLRESLSLDKLLGERISLHLTQMNLELSGSIVRTRRLGKTTFEMGIDYSADAPEYWRECLMDLLPRPGELDVE